MGLVKARLIPNWCLTVINTKSIRDSRPVNTMREDEIFNISSDNFPWRTAQAFRSLVVQPEFVDVTLACEDDKQLVAHKIILSSSSSFFRQILQRNFHERPLIFLDGIQHKDLVRIVDFIYQGRAEVTRADLKEFLRVGNKLKIAGLIDNGDVEKIHKSSVKEINNKSGNSIRIKDEFEDKELVEIETKASEMHCNKTINDQAPVTSDERLLIEATPPPRGETVEETIDLTYESEGKVSENGDKSENKEPELELPKGINVDIPEFLHSEEIKPKKQEALFCEFCDFRAAEKGNLNRHKFYKHSKKPSKGQMEKLQNFIPKEKYQCEKCDHSEARESKLRHHFKLKHENFAR